MRENNTNNSNLNTNNLGNTDLDQELEVLREKAGKELETIEIPESLSPENIAKKLEKSGRKPNYTKRITAICASAAVVVAAVGITTAALHNRDVNRSAADEAASSSDVAGNVDIKETFSVAFDTARPDDLAGFYHLASSAEEISDLVQMDLSTDGSYYELEGDVDVEYNGAFEESEESMEVPSPSDPKDDASAYDGAVSDGAGSDYSTTNVQVVGIDEGDIVKSDGTYLYIVKDNAEVYICSAVGGKLEVVGYLSSDAFCDKYISEIYINPETHRLIAVTIYYDYPSYGIYDDGVEDMAYTYCPGFYNSTVCIFNFDITDPEAPVKVDSFEQDGSYNTSRIVDGYLYLFTDYRPYSTEDIFYTFPCVGGCELRANDVYIPEDKAYSQLVMTSIDISNGKLEKVDTLSIITNYATIYMGHNSIYVLTSEYEYEETEDEYVTTVSSMSSFTNITKFGYAGGIFSAKAAARVNGVFTDTFSISENGNYFYMLVEDGDWNTSQNNLLVLDASLTTVGTIEDIAPGEFIYAARYLGDKAYFITYREVDPFFVADLSDPTNPKLLGNVEISGYSDYLHPFGDNLMLGIGFETVDNGYGGVRNDHVKLVMFDYSDPMNPQILDSLVLDKADYTSAVYNYKEVLASPSNGLIGFPIDNYEAGTQLYTCFKWTGDKFEEIKTVNFRDYLPDVYTEEIRGNYINDYMYITTSAGVIAFDLNNDHDVTSVMRYND